MQLRIHARIKVKPYLLKGSQERFKPSVMAAYMVGWKMWSTFTLYTQRSIRTVQTSANAFFFHGLKCTALVKIWNNLVKAARKLEKSRIYFTGQNMHTINCSLYHFRPIQKMYESLGSRHKLYEVLFVYRTRHTLSGSWRHPCFFLDKYVQGSRCFASICPNNICINPLPTHGFVGALSSYQTNVKILI